MRCGLSDETPHALCTMHLLQSVPAHPPLCQSPEQKGQIFKLGASACQGNPGCNKDQILPAEPGAIHINEIQPFFSSGVRVTDPSAPAVAPPAVTALETLQQRLGKKKNPHLGSWHPARKSISSHLWSVESKCIYKSESSCWCSAVNQFCFTKPLLFGLKLAKFRVYPALLFTFQGRFCLAASVTYGNA